MDKPDDPAVRETAKGLLQIIFVALVVLGTIGITVLLKATAPSGPTLSGEASNLVVDVVKPVAIRYAASQTITGEVEARANVFITPEISGRVVTVSERLQPGMMISEGDLLFAVDASDYEIAVERARADVASANADLTQANADAENLIRDWARVYPDQPAPDLVARKPQRDAIRARLEAAKAGLKQAELNLKRTKVLAPADIRIIESTVEIGQLVGPAGSYGNFFVADSLRIRASAEAEAIARLEVKSGSKVQVQKQSDGETWRDAQVISVGASLENRTRLLPLFIETPKDTTMQPGRFVSVKLTGVPLDNVMRLPAAAMATRTSVWRVSKSKLEEAEVIIHDTTGDYVIVSALDAKDGIVVSQVPTSFVSRPVKIRKTLAQPDITDSAS